MPTAQILLMMGSSVGKVCARDAIGADARTMKTSPRNFRMAGSEYREQGRGCFNQSSVLVLCKEFRTLSVSSAATKGLHGYPGPPKTLNAPETFTKERCHPEKPFDAQQFISGSSASQRYQRPAESPKLHASS